MSTLDQIADQIHEAEQADDLTVYKEHLVRARELLAHAVIFGTDLDRTRLQQFAIRAGANAQRLTAAGKADPMNETANQRVRIIRWGNFLTAISEYLESGGVPMADGRVATAGGWNYENCEPFWVLLNEETNARLVAHARKLIPNADEQACNSLLDKIVRQFLKDAPR